MFIRKAVSAVALAGLDAFPVAGLGIEGGFLTADFNGAASLTERMAIVDNWDATVGDIVANADDTNDIAALSALKVAVNELRADVTRESYMQGAELSPTAEAIDTVAISHPTPTGDTANSLSSQQHGADSEQEETENEQAQQEERKPRRRNRD